MHYSFIICGFNLISNLRKNLPCNKSLSKQGYSFGTSVILKLTRAAVCVIEILITLIEYLLFCETEQIFSSFV